jgi:hypothetical protein
MLEDLKGINEKALTSTSPPYMGLLPVATI